MQRSRVRRAVPVPNISTQKEQTKNIVLQKGIFTNIANDDMQQDYWRYATDTREVAIGRWETRLGNDFFSVPVGEAVNVQQTSTTGAADVSFSTTAYAATKLTATSTARLSAVEVNIKNNTSATGTVVVALYTDSSGTPGAEIARSTIDAASVASSYQYLKARFITCPDITNATSYWIVVFSQSGTGSYKISSTTTASTAATSSDAGTSWTTHTYALNAKLSTATSGGVKGVIRVKRPNGVFYTFFAHGSNLYSVNESTGVTTSVDSGLNSSATYCRFAFVSDTLFYATGLQKPRKYDFSTASEVTTAPEIVSDIVEHKGILFYLSAVDPTKMFYTNFAAYTTFTSTDFIYVPAPKTGDPGTAFAPLNGNLYIVTRNNKFILYGSENATFRLDEAPGQKGTFSQESVTYDSNYIYLATDDGIYRNNGAEEKNIATNILDEWTSLLIKSNTVLELHNNRLYVWFTPNGQSANTECWVYNILYEIWESKDLGAYVGQVYSRFEYEDKFLQGSNRIGMVMVGEGNGNDYANMGEPLTWELRTNYDPHGAPAQFKRIPTYRPHFDTQSGDYTVQVGYAKDYNNSPTYANVSLQGSGARFNTGETFNSGVTFGSASQVNPMDSGLTIPGEFRRLQLRYRHYAAREPVVFDGVVYNLELQRLI
jgi:hypothetical protein